jgi:hypothetical protein
MPRLQVFLRSAALPLRHPLDGLITIKVLRAPCDFNFENGLRNRLAKNMRMFDEGRNQGDSAHDNFAFQISCVCAE